MPVVSPLQKPLYSPHFTQHSLWHPIPWYEEKTYWKIDYYDQQLQYWCDPLSEKCRRVLTVMLASEY